MSQKADVLRILKAGDTITARQAWEELGIQRLSSRIGELKEDGYDIDNPLVKVGKGKWVTRYKLIPKEGQLELNLR